MFLTEWDFVVSEKQNCVYDCVAEEIARCYMLNACGEWNMWETLKQYNDMILLLQHTSRKSSHTKLSLSHLHSLSRSVSIFFAFHIYSLSTSALQMQCFENKCFNFRKYWKNIFILVDLKRQKISFILNLKSKHQKQKQKRWSNCAKLNDYLWRNRKFLENNNFESKN